MTIRKLLSISSMLYVLLCVATTAQAELFSNPKNLKVLPESTTPLQLRTVMREVSMGTGSRCSACHVGEVEADLSTYDFSLDDKENKHKARKMMLMTEDINRALADAFPDAANDLLTVTCATCHRGQSKPEMIEDVMLQTLAEEGLAESIAKYRALRERFYGGYSYDFSERMLRRLAEGLGESNQLEAAMAYLNLNLEYYPDSSRSYTERALIYKAQGDIAAARRDLEKGLEMEPHSRWIRQQLDNLN